MRGAFQFTVAAYAVVLVILAVSLPERVPAHFGFGGDVDRWASRTEFVVTMALIGAGLTALFALCGRLVDRSRLDSPFVNLPHKQWWLATPERTARVRELLTGDMYGIGAATMALLVVVMLGVLRAAHRPEPALGPGVLVALVVYLVAVIGWTIWMYAVRYRPQEDS